MVGVEYSGRNLNEGLTMKAKDCKIDQDIEVYLDSDGSISKTPTSLVKIGRVVMTGGSLLDYDIVVGWKDAVSAPSTVPPSGKMSVAFGSVPIPLLKNTFWGSGFDMSDHVDDYGWCVRLSFDTEVGAPSNTHSPVAATTQSVKYGAHCSRCNNYNEYAEVEAGKRYTCFSCRS